MTDHEARIRAEADKLRERFIEDYKARADEVAANITAELRAKGLLSEDEEVVFDMRVEGETQ